jgi:hypothetical protein
MVVNFGENASASSLFSIAIFAKNQSLDTLFIAGIGQSPRYKSRRDD